MITLRPADSRYPPRLHEMRSPPDPLYVSGALPDSERPAVAIVGTRRSTPYGVRVAREITYALAAAGAVIVSGLAQGIDSVVHQAAIDAGGLTIAVLGEGIVAFERSRPLRRRKLAAAIREHGAIVSEYALDAPALTWTFPRRNGTIAALADAVVVVEAPHGSGALITADRANDLERPVFAIPGPYRATTWAGSHEYIAKGFARLLLGPEPVAELLGLTIAARPSVATETTGRAARVLEILVTGPADTDTIAAGLGTPADTTATLIADLLLSGAIVPTGDGRFARAASR